MGKRIRLLLLLLVFLGFITGSSGQFLQNHPPEPMMSTDSTVEPPCGSGDGGDDSGIPPPVGLCLPINDYLIPLLMSGIALGGYTVWRTTKLEKTSFL